VDETLAKISSTESSNSKLDLDWRTIIYQFEFWHRSKSTMHQI
jgi:hypothetical protein